MVEGAWIDVQHPKDLCNAQTRIGGQVSEL